MRQRPLLIAAVALGVQPLSAFAQTPSPTQYAAASRVQYLPLDLVRDGTVRMPRPLSRRVTVERQATLLQQVLLDIATQAGLGLSYGEAVAKAGTLVTVSLKNMSAADALAAAVSGTPWAVVVNPSGQVAVIASEDQRIGSVTGRVTERISGTAVSGARVQIDETRLGATTDDAGRFEIANVPPGTYTLTVRRIGYARYAKSIVVADVSPTTADVALDAAASVLDQVVVTGVPTATSKRTLGNSVTTIDASAATQRSVTTTVNELLQAKAAGVSVMNSSGTPGTAGTIRIRGAGSLASATEPVVYLDGVRIASGAAGNFRNSWESPNSNISATQTGGGQDASFLSSLNPDEIESIEIIKGPAAATLYGADAANGVIQIITKRGQVGERRGAWHAKVQRGATDWGLGRRSSFTTCTPERIAAKLPDGSAAWPGCSGSSANSLLSVTSLDDGVLRTGNLGQVSLSLTGGGDGYSYFTSADRSSEQGVWQNSDMTRSSGRASFSFFPSKRVDYSVTFGVSRSDTHFPMGDNGTNMLESAWTFQPGSALKRGQEAGFAAGNPRDIDIYDNRLQGDRIIVGTTLNVQPLSWFRNRLTVGGDLVSEQANRYVAPGSLWAPVEGQMTQGAPRSTVYTVDYAGTATGTIPFATLSSALSIGAQYTNRQYRNTISQGNNFPSASTRDIALSAVRSGWSEFVDVKSLGVYAQEQIGWRDRFFVTGAVRIDNSSVFGDDIKQLYYPKISAAYVLSEESFVRRHEWLDELKVRAAYGQAGNAPDPFAAVQSYTSAPGVDNITGSPVPMLRLNTKGNPSVKPERGSEIEAGIDAQLFKSRVTLDLTYYNKTTKDALMQVPNAPSEGFPGSTFQNLGEINNKGVELGLGVSAIQREQFAWDSRLVFSTNANKLVRFGYKRDPIIFGLTTMNQRHVEGYPLGGFWVHDPVKNAEGAYVASAARYVGPADPKREVSLSNTATLFKRLRVFGLLDYKGGFYVTNQTDWRRCAIGVCWEVNDPNRSADEKKLFQLDLPINDALYTQKGDFIKLRDLSISYDIPARLMGSVGVTQASLTLAGHNLGILWKNGYTGLDPEVNFAGTNGPTGAFNLARVDYWTMPMTRRVTLALNLGF
jgi:TonB-linked SusC/RagA family outer membrane protein